MSLRFCLFGRSIVMGGTLVLGAITAVSAADSGRPFVENVPSPFARDGEAVIFRAPEDSQKSLVWEIEQIEPGEPYAVTFFFQNHVTLDPQKLEAFTISVVDGGKRIYRQRLYSRNHAQFFSTDVVFESQTAEVHLAIRPGMEIVVGDIGRTVGVDDLASVRGNHSSLLWPPSLRLPDIYRGLRKFEVDIRLWAGESGTVATLDTVEIRAGMKMTAAKLPRLMPGQNSLRIVQDTDATGGRVSAEITPRRASPGGQIEVEFDEYVPADGATFGRVMVSATDREGALVSGAFFRLRPPAEVNAYPYVRAISDWRKLQSTREFHLTSIVPGTHRIGFDRWNGKSWEKIKENFEVTFQAAEQTAPDFLRTDLTRTWIQPTKAKRKIKALERLDLSWRNDVGEDLLIFKIDSELSPRVDWRVQGPVKRLGIHAAFQPDSRTLQETAQTLREIVTRESKNPSRDFALGVEEYVGLNVEGVLPDPFFLMDYQTFGQLHREGRGWCNQFARATHVLMMEGGLESRLRNTPSHVMGEVRSADLEPMYVDAMLQVAITDDLGNRTMLDLLETDGTRVIGADVDEQTRRGSFSGYLVSPLPVQYPWTTRDPTDTVYRNAMLDNEIFSIDLQSWENLTWSSGSVPDMEMHASLGRVAENQTLLTKTSKLSFSEFEGSPDVVLSGLLHQQSGSLAPAGTSWGKLLYRFHTPVEVDHLIVSTNGMLGGGGRIAILLRPEFNRPLIIGSADAKVK